MKVLKKAFLEIIILPVCIVLTVVPVFLMSGCVVLPSTTELSTSTQIETSAAVPITVIVVTSTYLSYVEVSPVSGPPNTVVTISFREFRDENMARAWFDENDNTVFDGEEPTWSEALSYEEATSSNIPGSATLKIPQVPPGDYHIYVDIPIDLPIEFDFIFHVPGSSSNTWLWIILGIFLVILVSLPAINSQITKINARKAKECLEKARVTLKTGKVSRGSQVSPDTPIKANIAINVDVAKSASQPSINAKGSLIRDVKEGK